MATRFAVDVSARELERAARILVIRSRREASSAFTGGYTTAFRGGGLEFDELRPYVPGDDVRTIDWNATARTGAVYVKRFREEREKTLLLALDTSASMRFGTAGRAKVAVAAHALALLAAAAGRAGDRIGLLAFDSNVHTELAPARGEAHVWRVVRAAICAARESRGRTDLRPVLARSLTLTRPRSVLVLLSDFRGDGPSGAPPGLSRGELASVTRRHEVVALVAHDPREDALPDVGSVRLCDPERRGRSVLLRSGGVHTRRLYRAACAARRRDLERELRAAGVDTLFLRSDRDPLGALARLFRERASRVRVAA